MHIKTTSSNKTVIKLNKRVPVCKKAKVSTGKTTVVLGGGAAGLLAAETLRIASFWLFSVENSVCSLFFTPGNSLIKNRKAMEKK